MKDELMDAGLDNGGDLIIQPQFACVDVATAESQKGDLAFVTPGYGEVIKIKDNGDIYVKGNFVTNDMEVVDALREFFGLSKRRVD